MKSSDGNTGTAGEVLGVVVELVQQAAVPMTPLQRMEGLRAVNARVEAGQRRRITALALALVGSVAAAAGALILMRSLHQGGAGGSIVAGEARETPGRIGYEIQGGEVGDGGYIRSFASAGSRLRFAEGTEVHLMTGARGRLTSVDDRGARFAIEEGEAEVKVTPRPGARWLVDAGPFLITVRGTVFTASWDGARERLDVRMKKGLVSVSGPLANGVISVRAGQHLSVNTRRKEVLLREVDPGEAASGPASASEPLVTPPPAGAGEAPAEAPGSEPSSEPASEPSSDPPSGPAFEPSRARTTARGWTTRASSSSGNRPPPPRAHLAAARSWSVALAAGDLDDILDQADRKGLRRSLAEASSEDLAALADAARYRRRDDVARRALLAERERFPRSSRAHDSAFLLGRLEESRNDGIARALEWYDLYLKEAPSGAYSSEALGRKMTATKRLRGLSAAREVAEEYLRRFPAGIYAGAARALRDTP